VSGSSSNSFSDEQQAQAPTSEVGGGDAAAGEPAADDAEAERKAKRKALKKAVKEATAEDYSALSAALKECKKLGMAEEERYLEAKEKLRELKELKAAAES